MNAVLHAYPAGEGRIHVEATGGAEEMTIRVSDTGIGIRPGAEDPRGEDASLRLGLTLIAALSAGYEIAGAPGKGTTVTVRIPIGATDFEPVADTLRGADGDGVVRLTTPDGAVLPHVLSRAIGAFAAAGDLPVDRLSDSLLLADALADAATSAFGDADPCFDLALVDGGLELAVGPLDDAGAQRLRSALDVPGGHGSMELLVDEVRT
jgi:hypothetical protein